MEEHGESTGRELAVLVPQEVREVNFYGDVLLVQFLQELLR